MRLSTFKIGAAHLRSIAEIAPKSPLVCENRCPIRNGFVFVPAQKLYGIMQTWPKIHLKRARLQDQIKLIRLTRATQHLNISTPPRATLFLL